VNPTDDSNCPRLRSEHLKAIRIADTATVDPRAAIADGVEIGPYCVIGPRVRIGPDSRLASHVVLIGDVRLGARNRLGPFAALTVELDRDGMGTGFIELGDDNRLEAGVAVAASSASTVLGDWNRLGPRTAIAPGATVRSRVELGAGVTLGPGARIDSEAVLGPGVVIEPRVRIGHAARVEGLSRVARDVPCHLTASGSPARPRAVHRLGLERQGASPEAIATFLLAARWLLQQSAWTPETARELEARGWRTPAVERLFAFLEQRGRDRSAPRQARSKPDRAA